MSGFTGFGHRRRCRPRWSAAPPRRPRAGSHFAVSVWTGCVDGAGAGRRAGGRGRDRSADALPVRPGDPRKINAGASRTTWTCTCRTSRRWWGRASSATSTSPLVEVTGITADGALIPSSSVGNNNTWMDEADRVILEVNSWQPAELEGMHDIYYGTALPPHRTPIRSSRPSDRIGEPYLRCPPEKIIAVVPDECARTTPPRRAMDATRELIGGHVLDFLTDEVRHGRLPARRCCRCSRAWATSPTRCWPGWTTGRSGR